MAPGKAAADYGNGQSASGLTLIELSIVLACASILLALAVPNFQRLQQEFTLWGGARQVESSLQWGRMHAVSANTSLLFQIDEDGGGFRWMDPDTDEPYGSTFRRLPGRVRIVGAPRRPLRYFPKGNAAPAGTFVLQGDAGTYRVVVNPAGRIRVQRD
jgi:prepilin-type N-terminal cleavage/methylation domain-containing protein